ncbi:uncharacterized protein FA14DRAFT_172680 [Meira miltonrushii]|uniref:HMG box domain-containing protein n=1 Tax=Meira miltonrushii TaxID=1280837 RepID=A0A316VEU1_9BASI|nr:uncharacterized protein FA14DRAFT_172680 [Meira miltonrushii]PWN36102.1 hypothetical protein FA14DRAFT_172680 [Meira miltonrushii]
MAEPLLSFDISKRRRGNRSALPPRPPNAWILYRSDKMREIQRERKSSMLSKHQKPRNLSSSSSSTSSYDCPSVQGGPFMKDELHPTSTQECVKSLSPTNVDRIDETGGGANCLQAQISRMVSQMWKNESEEVKEHYAKLAAKHKLEHQKQYPNYRYQPKRRSRMSLPAHDTHQHFQHPTDYRRMDCEYRMKIEKKNLKTLTHFISPFLKSAHHIDGHYDSLRGMTKRDWHNASWPSWQNPWNGGQGHNAYESPLTLQQIGYSSSARPTFRGGGSQPHEKRSQSDGIYSHPLMPQSEPKYASLPTSTGMQSPALLPPTTHAGRSNPMMQVSMQPQQYPIQPAYVPTQVPINTQVPEGGACRSYSDNLAAMHLQQQTITTTTSYSSDQPMLVPLSHSHPPSQLYDGGFRKISPSQSTNGYTSISPDVHQHLQLHPTTTNQRAQQMPEMDMLQNFLAAGNTTSYNGSPSFK